MFGPEVVWVNNFGLVRAVSALYALSTLSVLREAAGDQLSRYRSAARRCRLSVGLLPSHVWRGRVRHARARERAPRSSCAASPVSPADPARGTSRLVSSSRRIRLAAHLESVSKLAYCTVRAQGGSAMPERLERHHCSRAASPSVRSSLVGLYLAVELSWPEGARQATRASQASRAPGPRAPCQPSCQQLACRHEAQPASRRPKG